MKTPKALTLVLLTFVMACNSPSTEQANDMVTPTQKHTLEQITSIFENGTPDFQYGYIEDIGDGAGVTCGRVGFTGGELKIMTSRYVEAKGKDTPLAQYLPCLEKQGDGIMKDYSCLFPSVSAEMLAAPEFKEQDGLISKVDFGKAWSEAGKDSVMQEIQDDYVDETYFNPSMKEAAKLGLQTPLAGAFIYDAEIQMNTGPLFQAIQKRFADAHAGRVVPSAQTEEIEWLRIYLKERKEELSGNAIGAGTTYRVDALGEILDEGNLQLSLPLSFDCYGEHFVLTLSPRFGQS